MNRDTPKRRRFSDPSGGRYSQSVGAVGLPRSTPSAGTSRDSELWRYRPANGIDSIADGRNFLKNSYLGVQHFYLHPSLYTLQEAIGHAQCQADRHGYLGRHKRPRRGCHAVECGRGRGSPRRGKGTTQVGHLPERLIATGVHVLLLASLSLSPSSVTTTNACLRRDG